MLFAGSPHAGAQDLKSILSGIAKTVVGDKATTQSSILGTWTYTAPACQFESESLLTKAGGEVAAGKVEEKLSNLYSKFGLNKVQFTFNADSTYTYTVRGKKLNGKYTFNAEEKTIKMTTSLRFSFTAHVVTTGSSMNLLFNADKLMSILKTMTSAASTLNKNASTINSIANMYDGMLLGFELEKHSEK